VFGACVIGLSAHSSVTLREALQEIYQEKYSMEGEPLDVRFVGPSGRYLAVAKPTSSKSPANGWQIHVVDLEVAGVVARKQFNLEAPERCVKHPFRMEPVQQNGAARIWLDLCGESTASLTVPDLADDSHKPTVLPDQPMQTKALHSERGPGGFASSALLIDVRGLKGTCTIQAPSPPAPELIVDLDGRAISPDGALVAGIYTYGRVLAPGKTAFVERIGLAIYAGHDCSVISSHMFRDRPREAPSSLLMFAGPSWSWLVSSSSFKTDKRSTIEIWDWRLGKLVSDLKHPRGVGRVMDVSTDGRLVIGRIDDDPEKAPRQMQDFAIWRVESGELLAESLAYSKKELLNRIEREHRGSYDAPDGKSSLNYLIDWVEDIRFSQDGRRILHVGAGRITVYAWDVKK